jgi:hypothetical protein
VGTNINKDSANLNQHFEKGRASMSSFFYQMLATFNELKIMSELYMTTEKGFKYSIKEKEQRRVGLESG